MLICQGGTRMSRHLDDKIRAECLTFMLNWQGPQLPDSARETVQLDAQDLVSRFSFYTLLNVIAVKTRTSFSLSFCYMR